MAHGKSIIPAPPNLDENRFNIGDTLTICMLGCGNTRLYELLAAHEPQSFRDGCSRKITVESIRLYIARQLALRESMSTDLPRRRGRRRKAGVQP